MRWQDDPCVALGAADVMVQASIEPDSSPTVILETMPMTEPLIAGSPGGASELVIADETGLVVSPGDLPSLAGALRFCCAHRDRCIDMREKGRRRLRTHFDLQRKVGHLLEVYAGLTRGSA